MDEDSTWRDILLWKENIREFMKRIRQRPVRSSGSGGSGGSGQMDQTMWRRPDKDGGGWTKMGTNPDNSLSTVMFPVPGLGAPRDGVCRGGMMRPLRRATRFEPTHVLARQSV